MDCCSAVCSALKSKELVEGAVKMSRRQSGTIILRYVKKKQMEEVRERYAKFGDDIVRQMLHCTLRANGLRQILRKLNLGGMPGSDKQAHERIAQCIQERGVAEVLAILNPSSERKKTRFVKTLSPESPPESAPDPPAPAESAAEDPLPGPQPQRSAVRRPGEYSLGGREQRRFQRIQADLQAAVAIKLAEDAPESFESNGKIQDVSIRGLCLIVPNLPQPWHSALSQTRGCVLLRLQLPGKNRPSAMSGRIAWMDYQGQGPHPFCKMGVDLSGSEPASKRVAEALVKAMGT
jgi:hypothetical protein